MTGMLAVIQTFGERINFHPHIQCLVTEGGQARMFPSPRLVWRFRPLCFHYPSRGLCRFGRVILILGYQQMEFTENGEGLGASPKRKYL